MIKSELAAFFPIFSWVPQSGRRLPTMHQDLTFCATILIFTIQKYNLICAIFVVTLYPISRMYPELLPDFTFGLLSSSVASSQMEHSFSNCPGDADQGTVFLGWIALTVLR